MHALSPLVSDRKFALVGVRGPGSSAAEIMDALACLGRETLRAGETTA